MSADIIPIGRGMQILRGPDDELKRQSRVSLRRRAAYRRAVWGNYEPADRAMFGPPDYLLVLGPQDLQVQRPAGGPTAA